MKLNHRMQHQPYRVFQRSKLNEIPQISKLSAAQKEEIMAVSAVLPFRVNSYVLDELIDWDAVPDDPMFRLTFPMGEMLERGDLELMLDLVRSQAPEERVRLAARGIQKKLNPHPAGQVELNVPTDGGHSLQGLQHKYPETVLFFPAQGQTCHAYCTYCFRWAQFVNMDEVKFLDKEAGNLVRYLRRHPEVTDVLFTGGDPMVMRSRVLQSYVDPLLNGGLESLRSIRIGTKAPAYWPQRFVTDSDADELLRLFERVVERGLHLAIMAHYSHPRELETPMAREALRRIRSTGAVIRCQAPLIRHVNDDPGVWARMWKMQVHNGAVPYYMFVERDTGARNYFEVPLARALDIFQEAFSSVSGLARTVRGPSMSATPGKVLVDGVTELGGQKVFVLKFIQARDPSWVNRLFFAAYNEHAAWLDDLIPASGEAEFFFEGPLQRLRRARLGLLRWSPMRTPAPLAGLARGSNR